MTSRKGQIIHHGEHTLPLDSIPGSSLVAADELARSELHQLSVQEGKLCIYYPIGVVKSSIQKSIMSSGYRTICRLIAATMPGVWQLKGTSLPRIETYIKFPVLNGKPGAIPLYLVMKELFCFGWERE